MKTFQVEFQTSKNIGEIGQIITNFSKNIEQIGPSANPLINSGVPDISVLVSGRATFLDSVKNWGAGMSQWGIQVFVDDRGEFRSVELVALGASATKAMIRAYADNGGGGFRAGMDSLNYFNFRHSKMYCNKLADLLR